MVVEQRGLSQIPRRLSGNDLEKIEQHHRERIESRRELHVNREAVREKTWSADF